MGSRFSSQAHLQQDGRSASPANDQDGSHGIPGTASMERHLTGGSRDARGPLNTWSVGRRLTATQG